jgi:hypothetical protein
MVLGVFDATEIDFGERIEMLRVCPCNHCAACGSSLLVAVLSFCITGCGGGPKLYRVSGNVTFAGKPIPEGKIYFTPDGAKENSGAPGFANIKDGKYDTSGAGGQGHGGGPMAVRIEGSSGIGSADDAVSVPPLFQPYETTADLPKSSTTKDFDVPASAADAKPLTAPQSAPGV